MVNVSNVKRITGQVRKAIQHYGMVKDGDRIAVGISGGKDSLCLLHALSSLKAFYPCSFEIEAVTISLGLEGFNISYIKSFCESLKINYTVENTLIGKIIFEKRKESNPCSLCANMRRGALNNAAKRLKCNKVALGHSMDDVMETFLMSLFYEGRINTFMPVTWLDRKQLHIIRPLIYVEERQVKGYINELGINPVESPCPVDKKTQRQYVKNILSALVKDNKDVKGNIFGAIKRSELDGWR